MAAARERKSAKRKPASGSEMEALASLEGEIRDLLGSAATQEETLEALERRMAEASTKAERRLLRRALYRLRQKGLSVPDLTAPKGEPAYRPQREIRETVYATEIDGRGGRLVLYVRPGAGAGGAVRIYDLVLSDVEGIQAFHPVDSTKKKLRKYLEQAEQGDVRFVEVSPSEGRRAIRYALEAGRARDMTPPPEFERFRSDLGLDRPAEEDPPVASTAEASAEPVSAEQLLEAGRMRGWLIDEDRMKEYGEQHREASESRLVLDPARKEERLREVVQESISDYFGGERGERMARRLEAMAPVLEKTAGPGHARAAREAARGIREKRFGPRENAVISLLFQRSLELYLKLEREESKGRVIVRP